MDTELNMRESFSRRPDSRTAGLVPISKILGTARARETRNQFQCSPGQYRFWSLHQLDSAHPALNISVRWRLEGKVFNGNLEKAFRLIIARHPVLRTCFVEVDGEPLQIVLPQITFRIPIIDLMVLPEASALLEVERNAHREARTPFDLSSPPLIRVTHVRLNQDVSILLITLHHIVGDHESINILMRDMCEICTALHKGRLPMLPVLPLSYGDFVVRQARLEILARNANTEFWKRALQGIKPFEIQPDHPRPQVLTTHANVMSAQLETRLIHGLTVIAQQQDGTLFNAVLAVLLMLLHRYTGETDIAIGSEATGRDNKELENVLGLFSNPVVLRNDLSGDPDFAELLRRVGIAVTGSLKHQAIMFEKLVEMVSPQRDPSRHPLFSVNFSFQPAPGILKKEIKDIEAGFRLTASPRHSAGAICDLSFLIFEGSEGWQISCEYNIDLFEGATVKRLLRHFTMLLRSIVADPTQKISRLPILDEAERRALLIENNRTAMIYPRHLTFPQIFQAQAARTPEAVALICGEQTMSYRDLDMASNRLAHELHRRGVNPGSRVAVFLDRSPDLVVALIATLKSGSAYIPLDPAYPAERLGHVFENSKPALVITRAELHERLGASTAPVLLIDADGSRLSEQSMEPLAASASPEDPAYIIYTSGSTGRPKGVVIPHRGLVNLLYAMRSRPGITLEDTVVCVSTISFDIAAMELFLPLIVGARLVLAKEQERIDGSALLSLLQRQHATFMQATPATWRLLLETDWHGQPPLKMLCGGEALPRKLAEKLLQCGGELWNMYGPTETSIWSSVLQIMPGEGPVLIGPPIANTQFYILDHHQQLVPHGVPGELYIAGDGVALGYLDLPELTAERFVPDRFKSGAAKMYRTGDMVRMKQQGCMEYLGRTDHQIKLRGFRIELGEIEAVMLRHPAITEAVAVLGQDASGESALWAYAVALPAATQSETATLSSALRASLAQSLPGYMCPSSIVILDALPRTPNGKIDRRSLPPPTAAPCPNRKETSQLLNEVERRLATIWSSSLGIESIDKTADFFELGGHSLLAARLLARIENEFAQRLSLFTLFKVPNIEAQAKLLMQGNQREYDFRQVVRFRPAGSKRPLIAIHNTGVCYYQLSKQFDADQPLTALQLFDPSIANPDLPKTIEEIAAGYVQLIYKFQPAGPYHLIGWCVGGVLAFEVGRQLAAAGHEVPMLFIIEAWAPGHSRRISRWRAILADYSYRWQLIAADWQRVMWRQQSFGMFLARRTLAKKLLRWFGLVQNQESGRVTFETRDVSAENYDQWLLGYLEDAERCYQPKPYSGKIILLRSALEPHGIFLDRLMGWSAFATGGVELAVIDGDHFTIFQGRGLEQMAKHIAGVLDSLEDGTRLREAK